MHYSSLFLHYYVIVVHYNYTFSLCIFYSINSILIVVPESQAAENGLLV